MPQRSASSVKYMLSQDYDSLYYDMLIVNIEDDNYC